MQQKPVAGSGCNDVCEFKLFVNLALGRRLRLESESQGRQASNSGLCPTDLAPTILQRSVATFSYGTVLARDLPMHLSSSRKQLFPVLLRHRRRSPMTRFRLPPSAVHDGDHLSQPKGASERDQPRGDCLSQCCAVALPLVCCPPIRLASSLKQPYTGILCIVKGKGRGE